MTVPPERQRKQVYSKMPAKRANQEVEKAARAAVAAGFVLDGQLLILEFLGNPDAYVEFAPGAASLRLQKVVHPRLRRIAVEVAEKALSSRKPIRRRDVRFRLDGELRTIDVTAQRTSHPKGGDSCIEIRFEEAAGSKLRSQRPAAPPAAVVESRERGLEEELAAARLELEEEAQVHDQTRQQFSSRVRAVEEDRERSVAELEQAYAELEANLEELQIAVSDREAAEAEVRGQRDFIEAVLDSAEALILVMDREGRILRSNRACERAMGETLSQGRLFRWSLIPADQRGEVRKVFEDVLSGRFPNHFENDWLRTDGSHVRIAWSNTALVNSAGAVTHGIAVGIDVTEQRMAEAGLRDSEAANRALIEAAPLGVVAVDRANRIHAVNEALERMFGYERAELLGKPLNALFPKRFRRAHRGHQERSLQHPVSRPMEVDTAPLGLAKDGREFPIEVGIGYFEAAGGSYAVAFVTDVTEKVLAQRTIERDRDEIRDLAARLMTAQEDEQRRIARELHDGLVQELVALKLDLAVLARNPATAQAGLLEEMKRAESGAQRVAENARAISHELHPAALEHLGLVPALRTNAAQVQRSTGIELLVEADRPAPPLPLDVALGLYRIAQEAVWNAARHSGAQSVTVAVRVDPDEISLEVIDQGKGFDLADVRGRRSLGLVSMEERARLIGAELEIDSQPGQGTIVRTRLKL